MEASLFAECSSVFREVLCDGFKTEELPKAVKIEKADRLGRCVWDAFYPRVTSEGIKQISEGKSISTKSFSRFLQLSIVAALSMIFLFGMNRLNITITVRKYSINKHLQSIGSEFGSGPVSHVEPSWEKVAKIIRQSHDPEIDGRIIMGKVECTEFSLDPLGPE
ncbi:protein disulfide isomerase-like 5-4 [Artemisia annua]|uniref:Protein disulfide isomerase-like 5-4 n=1 Tax=Artemisia annua TaxID=35608 RepID=A0A2U1NQV7_ARTAN|nr:protein disulfide isomerase-like 5-4 [Artemisia annua]